MDDNVTEEDYKSIRIIHDLLAAAIQGMSVTEPRVFKDGRFAHWLVTALMNMLVNLHQSHNISKQLLINSIDEIWDQKKRKYN